MVPIVYGAPLESYYHHFPPDSFLHVNNFSSPKELSEYIQYLHNNDENYLRYHEWRKNYVAFYEDILNTMICTECRSKFYPRETKIEKKSLWYKAKFLSTLSCICCECSFCYMYINICKTVISCKLIFN